MEFRSHSGEPIRVPLLSGHTAIVGAEWRSLPEIFHHDAIKAGCERRKDGPPPEVVPARPSAEAINQVADHDTAYRQALATMISRNDDNDFTAANLPNLKVVGQLCGFSANREDVYRVFREMKAEAGVGT